MNKIEAKTALNNLVEYLSVKAVKATLPGGRFKNRLAKRLVNKLKLNFNKQMMWLLKEVEKLPAFQQSKAVKMYTKKEISQDVNTILENMPYQLAIAEDIVTQAGTSMLKGGKSRIKSMNLGVAGVTFSLNHPEAVAYLEALKELQLSNYRGSINRTTKDVIKQLLVDGANTGESYSSIAKQITEQGKAGVFSQARGELIATREIGFAYGKGERVVVDDYVGKTGAVMEKNWLTAHDGAVRPMHKQNEKDGWIPIGQVFSGTSEDAAPSSDFGCRCVTSYREV